LENAISQFIQVCQSHFQKYGVFLERFGINQIRNVIIDSKESCIRDKLKEVKNEIVGEDEQIEKEKKK